MFPLVCDACGDRFPVKSFTADQYAALEFRQKYEEAAGDLRMLRKVKSFYERYPEAEGKIRSHSARVMESDDPEVIEKAFTLFMPVNQIELPPEHFPPEWSALKDDAEAMEFLRRRDFRLDPWLESLSQEVARLEEDAPEPVACPACPAGRLFIDNELWFDYNDAVYGSIVLYWPDCHGFDDDGTLHVKRTGATGHNWWTGEHAFAPDDPDYAFFRWLVAQKEYHRLVNQTELPAIREEWKRRVSGSG
jgi:hypothetical protein